jgi:hypothetical protein
MFESFKFIVVEDIERDRAEVLNQLADAGFDPANLLARPSHFEEAVEAIREHADSLDVVFLDLNLPRDATDARPAKGMGRNMLNLIHGTLNPKANIRVVVVSGEDLLDGFSDQMMYDLWPGTLASIAQKSALAPTLRASLRRLRKDPFAQALRRAKMENILALYDVVADGSQPIGERVSKAKAIGLLLVGNEVDHNSGRVGYSSRYGENLHLLIRDEIESRFAANSSGRSYIDIGEIKADGGWGAFLWRGAMVQHLYALNQYRNTYVHISEQPYQHAGRDRWEIPRDLLKRASDGRYVGVVIESIVRDLIEWYLPWHEQVYLPWREGQT